MRVEGPAAGQREGYSRTGGPRQAPPKDQGSDRRNTAQILARPIDARPNGRRCNRSGIGAGTIRIRRSRILPSSSPGPNATFSNAIPWLPQHELLAAALVRGPGSVVQPAGSPRRHERMPTVFFLDHGAVTSRELVRLEMEVDMIARKGVRGHRPLNGTFTPDERLSEEQRRAVSKIMQSRSFITLFRGAAGTGKSTSLREVQRGLLAAQSSGRGPRAPASAGPRP